MIYDLKSYKFKTIMKQLHNEKRIVMLDAALQSLILRRSMVCILSFTTL